jgi:hypothetical protein
VPNEIGEIPFSGRSAGAVRRDEYVCRQRHGGFECEDAQKTGLESGWGDLKGEMTFSPKNFHLYFSAFGRVYGSYLFCLYFELFGRWLRPSKSESEIVASIRESQFLEPRWPEMVTFEENGHHSTRHLHDGRCSRFPLL